MIISNNWFFALGLFSIGFGIGGYIEHHVMQGRIDKMTAAHTEELRVREVQRANDEKLARDRENGWVEKASQIEQEKTNEIARIRGIYTADINRLQNRADRKPANPSNPAAPSPTCQGSTGAELSRPDAVFLSGEAARADEQRTALSACYQAYDSVAR